MDEIGFDENSVELVRNMFNLSAHHGFVLGAYTSLLGVCVIFSENSPALGLVALAMMICWPLALARLMRLQYRLAVGGMFPSDMCRTWLVGYFTQLFASLIVALVMYVMLEYVEPGYIAAKLDQVIQMYRSMPGPDAATAARTLEGIISEDGVPGNIQVACNTILAAAIAGTVVSLLMAAIVRIAPVRLKDVDNARGQKP